MADERDPTASPGDDDHAGWAAPGGVAREPDLGGAPPESTLPTAPPPETAPAAAPGDSPPVPAASAPAPPAAPVRRSRAWLVVLLSLTGVALVAAIAGTVLFVDRTLPPYDAAHQFLDAVALGRRAEATALLCERDRAAADDVIDDIARTLITKDRLFVNLLDVDRRGDTATVGYSLDDEADGDTDGIRVGGDTSFELVVVEQDGDWFACPGRGPLR